MSETAPFPYCHDMGPRDSRSTVYEGLRRGFHFGFVGSTDHHAGYPGSYGDGKLAALAARKDRESIFSALEARRTWAVTGDRIVCDFTVDGAPMGSIVPASGGGRTVSWRVEGGYPLEKVVLFKNLAPVHVLCGDLLPGSQERGRYKLRVEMGWGGNTDSLYRWEGEARVAGGALLGAEPCFRGRSVLSPTEGHASGDDVNDIDNCILSRDGAACRWQCFTVKNPTTLHPQTCAVILEIEGGPDTQVEIAVNGRAQRHTLAALCRCGYTEHMRPWHAQAYKVHTAFPACTYTAAGTYIDDTPGARDFYHMEVAQRNGCWAFVTPVWFE